MVKAANTNNPNQQQSPTDAQIIVIAGIVASSYQSPSWDSEFNALLTDWLFKIYLAAIEDQKKQTRGKRTISETFHDFAHRYTEKRTAELVKNISESTRKMLRTELINDMKAGKTVDEIANDLIHNKAYAFSDARAFCIARTETGFAWNHAGIDLYEHDGCESVTVFDGDYDADCEEADGQIWSIAYARAHPLQHPNCVRNFGPNYDTDAKIDRA